jgi:hypothetical protein
VFIILKQGIETIKVEKDDSIYDEEDVIGMETDRVCVPQEWEPEVSHIVRWFLWWWLLVYIVMCDFAHMELLRLVDLLSCLCVWSFASVTMLTVDTVC